MHVFSFLPDRLLLSRKCSELSHYAGGSCLFSLPLYISHSQPLQCLCLFTLNGFTVNCQSVLCCAGIACWQMARRRGPRRVLSEAVSPVMLQQSEELWGEGEWKMGSWRWREGDVHNVCLYIYIYPKFFKRWKYHLSLWDRHSINVCENVLQQDVDTRHIWKWFVRKSCWKS